jgi:hypothetical protein
MNLTKEAKLGLLGKYAVLKEEILQPQYRSLEARIVKIGAGSFNPEMWVDKDNVCTISVDGHRQCWNWVDIERLATEEEIKKAKILGKTEYKGE